MWAPVLPAGTCPSRGASWHLLVTSKGRVVRTHYNCYLQKVCRVQSWVTSSVRQTQTSQTQLCSQNTNLQSALVVINIKHSWTGFFFSWKHMKWCLSSHKELSVALWWITILKEHTVNIHKQYGQQAAFRSLLWGMYFPDKSQLYSWCVWPTLIVNCD